MVGTKTVFNLFYLFIFHFMFCFIGFKIAKFDTYTYPIGDGYPACTGDGMCR